MEEGCHELHPQAEDPGVVNWCHMDREAADCQVAHDMGQESGHQNCLITYSANMSFHFVVLAVGVREYAHWMDLGVGICFKVVICQKGGS